MTKWRQMGVVFVLFGAMTQGWAYNAYYYQPTTLDIQEAQQKAEDHRRRAIRTAGVESMNEQRSAWEAEQDVLRMQEKLQRNEEDYRQRVQRNAQSSKGQSLLI